jgi:hypothetical protein
MYTQFWSVNLKGKHQSEDVGVDGRVESNIRMNLEKFGGKLWTQFV